MSAVYESSDTISAGGSATATLTISGVTLSGSNRANYGIVHLRSASQQAISSVTRTGDTYASGFYHWTTGVNGQIGMYYSSAEPVVGPVNMVFTVNASLAEYAATYLSATGVDPGTWFEAAATNVSGSVESQSLNVASSASETVVSAWLGFGTPSNIAATGTGHTIRESGFVDSASEPYRVGSRVGEATAATGYSWTTAHVARLSVFNIPTATPPVNTMPTSSGQCFQLDTPTAITSGDEPTVAAGTSAITSVTLAATAGLALTLDNTGTSVTFTGNGTNNVVLQNGASATEYNTVLATISYTATTRGKKTITMTTTDGTLSDEDSWYVLAAVRGISITGTHAQVKACYESLNSSGYGMVLDVGEPSGTVTVYAEDDTSPTALTDEQVISLSTIGGISAGLILAIRRRRKKKSGN